MATVNLVFNGSATGSLSSITFDYQALDNIGGTQGSFRAQNFDITVNGTAYEIQKQTISGNGNLVFTDVAALNTGSKLCVITSSRGTATNGDGNGNEGMQNQTSP